MKVANIFENWIWYDGEYYEGGNQRSAPAPTRTGSHSCIRAQTFSFPLQFQTFTSNIHIGKDVKHNYYVHKNQGSNSAEYF